MGASPTMIPQEYRQRHLTLDHWHNLSRPGRCCTQGALLSSDDCGSSVERTAKLHPLWQLQCGWVVTELRSVLAEEGWGSRTQSLLVRGALFAGWHGLIRGHSGTSIRLTVPATRRYR